MSHINPEIKDKFESLLIDLKNHILQQNAQLHSFNNLSPVLADVINADEVEGGA